MLTRSFLSVLCLLFTFSAFAQDNSCKTKASRIAEFAEKLSISIEAADHQVDQSIRLKWVKSDHQGIPSPSYLVIATSEVVRFGKGQFFALMPNASAPYQASLAVSKTRAFVPFSDTAAAAGELEIIPLRAGELKVSWGVIEPASCNPNAESTELSHLIIQVKAAGAQLVPAEEFSLQRSQEVRRSLDGSREILVFKNSYQVVDVVSGESLLRQEGRNPVFSPTGRFLISETLGEQTIEITDLEAGLQIFRGVGRAAAFVHGDSFVVISEWGPGATFLRTLQDVRLDDQQDEAPSSNSEDENAVSSGAEPAFKQNGFSLTLGDSLGSQRQSGSDGSYSGQRSFRLNIAAGLVAYQERSAWGQKEEDYSESAVEVRSLATMSAVDHSALIVRDEVRKFTRVPRSRELDAWFPGQKPALVYMIGKDIEGAQLTRTWAAIKQPNVKTQILIAEQNTRRLKGFTVANLPIRGATTSLRVTLDEFIGIEGYEALSPIRTSSSKAIARQMERDISRAYSKRVAKFGPIARSSYESSPFPDPNTTEELEPVAIDLSKEGYVIWQWKDTHNRLWFGQTVEAGRRARNFRYHLLMWNGAKAKWADLVEQAELFSASNDKTTSLETIEIGDFRGELDNAIREPATATVIAGRYFAFVPRPSSWIFVFDFEEWRPTCLIEDATNAGLTSWITLSKDRQSILQYNTDGTFSIYSCRTGDIILTGAYLDGEFIALHSAGYFIGSSEAESIVKIKIPGIPGKHYLGQYASQLRRPDLVRQAFGGLKLESPELRLPPKLDAVAGDGIIRLSSEGTGPLTELRLFGDGKLFRRIGLSGSKASFDIQEQELRIYRTVTAVAVDSRGVTSSTVRLPASNSQTAKRGTLYVIGLGVDRAGSGNLDRAVSGVSA